MPALIDLKGQTFGRLQVLEKTDKKCGNNVVWKCKCKCGNTTFVNGDSLRSRHTTSCGCYNRERASERFTTHGMSRTPEYETWSRIIQRTSNANNPDYHHYGGRGIEVCERWNMFENFFADMGPKPGPEYTVERENNDRGYEPGNCRWATQQEQANNKRNNVLLSHNGKTQNIAQWAAELGVEYTVLYHRLGVKKMSIEEVLEEFNLTR